jgi:type II secretory pathway pseudopilin PulG
MLHLPRRLRRQRGAALLLLLLLLGMGASLLLMGAVGPSTDAQRERQTMRALADAREALIGYAMLHGRLPRPAQADSNGEESTTPCTSPNNCTGLLPSATLGISALDGWGKLLRYSVTPTFTVAPIYRDKAVPDKQILTRNARGTVSYLSGQAICSVNDPCIPAVVLSTGKYNLGVDAYGLPQANGSTGNLDEIQNDRALTAFFSQRLRDNPGAPGGEFDDMVTWVPLMDLYRRMATNGKLP